MTTKLDDARDAIVNKVVDMLGVYKTHILGSGSGSTPQLTISDNLKLLPALTLGLLKHVSRMLNLKLELSWFVSINYAVDITRMVYDKARKYLRT